MAAWETPGKKSRINPLAYTILIHTLRTSVSTYGQLAERCGLHEQTLRRWMTPMRKAALGYPRLVRIAAWAPDPRGYLTKPAFAWGGAPDAPRIALSGAERAKRVRMKKKASNEK